MTALCMCVPLLFNAPINLPEPTPIMHKVLYDATVPEKLWPDFLAVAACESGMEFTAEGDSGRAKGLFQIHWQTWYPWAYAQGYVKRDDPFDPVANTRVARAIQAYSLARGQPRWDQWSVKPWPICHERAEDYLF